MSVSPSHAPDLPGAFSFARKPGKTNRLARPKGFRLLFAALRA